MKFTEDTKSPTAKLACETVSQNENNALVPQFTSFVFIATCDDSHVTWSVDNDLSLIVNNDFIFFEQMNSIYKNNLETHSIHLFSSILCKTVC